MNANDLRDIEAHLEALESLTKLFRTLWFDHIKGDIEDEKVKAYLMVYEDAFPGLDHVIGFVRKNSKALAAGEKTQEDFEVLTQTLLNREIETDLEIEEDFDLELLDEEALEEEILDEEILDEDEISEELTNDEREALQRVDQDDIDALFIEDSNGVGPDGGADDEVKAFFAEEEAGSPEEAGDLDALLGDAEDEEEEEAGDLDALLGDAEDEEEVPAEISEDEMAALLGDEEESQPAKTKKKSPSKKKKAKSSTDDDAGNGEKAISQDEIDALFG